ncbi:MAG: ABC transporter permease, partial [Gemmatimonadota bacterium]
APQIAVLSDETWRSRFGADTAVVGQTVTLNGSPYTVVGVLPPGFKLRSVLRTSDDHGRRALWVPIGHDGRSARRGIQDYELIGRLAPGATIDQAFAESEALIRGERDPSRVGVSLAFRQDTEARGLRGPIFLVLSGAGALLLVACANVATLLAGESTTRSREMATREALGAAPARIVRQLLTESVVLGLLGSITGVVVASVGTSALAALAPPIPGIEDVHVSGRILLFACCLGITTGLLFGLAPSFMFARRSLGVTLKDWSRGGAPGRRALQGTLVFFEIALTVVLLVTGGLLTRSLLGLSAVDTGFVSDNLATVGVAMARSQYTQSQTSALIQEIIERIEAIPGVEGASATSSLPFLDESSSATFEIEGRPTDEGGLSPLADYRQTFPGFHEVLGIPLLAGRTFTSADGPDASGVAIVSESMARRYWPNESPIGVRIRYRENWHTIVGVVGDVKHAGLDLDSESTYYISGLKDPPRYGVVSLVAKTSGDPLFVIPRIRQAVWAVESDVPVTSASTMSSVVSNSTSDERYRTLLMIVFGATAAVLAAVGIFGVTARAVMQRSRELGIRMALGARETGLIGQTLQGNLTTSLAGLAVGLVGAFWASRLISGFLFSIEPSDPLTYCVVATLTVAVCLLASYLPARRITRVNPVDVLRAD